MAWLGECTQHACLKLTVSIHCHRLLSMPNQVCHGDVCSSSDDLLLTASRSACMWLMCAQVSSASILRAGDMQLVPEYTCLPAMPTWHRAHDSSLLRIWLPPDYKAPPGNWQQKPCWGLDIYVDMPRDMQQAVGCVQTQPYKCIAKHVCMGAVCLHSSSQIDEVSCPEAGGLDRQLWWNTKRLTHRAAVNLQTQTD